VIAADVDKDQPHPDFLARVRPTLETAVAKGRVKTISADKKSVVLTMGEQGEQSFFVPTASKARLELDVGRVVEGSPVAVVFRTDGVLDEGKLRHVAQDFRDQAQTQPLWVSDITMRVMTEPIDLKPGVDVVHRYVLYNGPVKVMLLSQLTGDAAVPPAVVQHYLDDLHLNTLTDYQSPGVFGNFAHTIGWSQLIIWCTNVMHEVLFWLHQVLPNYGICIILLTVMVRGIMFPISRKQAMTSIRMQELAPELKKLQEKHKDDRQALGVAQMELYRKYGVNPFGTCWFLLLQMPVFMGLYYCLQESIHFRLAPFWPSWIINLAAPDMLFYWTEKIPVISRPEDYGGFFYLGPFFNLLPVVAVSLMVVQQKYTMPPPTDEQQAMQQNMMKYMMIFFGLMFYKVAAGLCVYFIASSLWGFAERKLLPKKKPADGTASPAEGLLQRIMKRDDNGPAASSTAVTTATARTGVAAAPGQQEPRGGKRRKGKRRREDGAARGGSGGGQDPAAQGGIRGWWQVRKEKLAAWWEEVLRQAEKKR
jgi:YidC/Oxa1 family membrane protein insertase